MSIPPMLKFEDFLQEVQISFSSIQPNNLSFFLSRPNFKKFHFPAKIIRFRLRTVQFITHAAQLIVDYFRLRVEKSNGSCNGRFQWARVPRKLRNIGATREENRKPRQLSQLICTSSNTTHRHYS